MPKYYVENGHLKQIVDTHSPLDACIQSLKMSAKEIAKKLDTDEASFILGQSFIISERGFISERESLVVDAAKEFIINTEIVLNCL